MQDISPIDFGRLIASNEALKESVDRLVICTKILDERIYTLERTKDKAFGILIGIGSLGGVIGGFVHKLLMSGHAP